MEGLKDLTKLWITFMERVNEDRKFTGDDVKLYRTLMAGVYKAIQGEWGNDKISKDLALLLVEVDKFGDDRFIDEKGASKLGQLHETIYSFHRRFLDEYKQNAPFLENSDDAVIFPAAPHHPEEEDDWVWIFYPRDRFRILLYRKSTDTIVWHFWQ